MNYNDKFKPNRFGDYQNHKYQKSLFSPQITRIIEQTEQLLLNKLANYERRK